MKRAAAALILFFSATLAFADGTSKYVVALERTAGAMRPAALIPDAEAAEITEFPTLNSFAADLTAEEAAELRRSPQVRYVERAVDRHILGSVPQTTNATRTYFGQTIPYGIEMVHAPELWNLTRGGSINVVVVDTGVDYRHDDLAAVYIGGYNAIAKTDDPMDDNGHGTHVAGTIAAADNDFGVVGVAPQVRLWAIKVLKDDGHGSTAEIIAAVDWIIQKKRSLGGAWVVNLSLGSNESNTAEQEAFQHAIDEGLLICAASGNDSELFSPAPVSYPAAYAGVLAIGAISESRTIANFSNQGPQIALVAPGVRVLSTARPGSTVGAVRTPATELAGRGITGSPKTTVSGKVVFCGNGAAAGDFPASLAGNIALIQRGGDLSLNQRTRNAKTAGATAVIIFNNTGGAVDWTFLIDSDPGAATFDWPLSIGLTKEDGDALRREENATITVTYRDDPYGQRNGTSMATPHAAGVAALVWSFVPSAPAAVVSRALLDAASDLGDSGFDHAFGYGVVDALAAAKLLAPNAFTNPTTPDPTVPSGRRVLRRGRR